MTTGTSPTAEPVPEARAAVVHALPLRDEDRLGAKRHEGVVWSVMVCVGNDKPRSIRSTLTLVKFILRHHEIAP